MRTLKIAGTTVRVTGGADREGGGEGPLVVLLHGFGAPGDDLVSLYRQLEVPREVRFAFPEGPIDVAEHFGPGYRGARAWWLIEPSVFEAAVTGERPDRTRVVPDGLAEARALLVQVLAELQTALSVPPSKIVLGGFSQGSMLSLDTALRSAERFAGLVLLSGSILALDEWQPYLSHIAGLRVVQAHGRSDPLLPFDVAVRLRDLLSAAGADVRWVEFAGGHTIPGTALDALGKLVREVAEPAG